MAAPIHGNHDPRFDAVRDAFESNFAPADPSRRKVFEAYQSMKLSLLRRDKKLCRANGGSIICKQIVISGVWLLLKQIL